MTQLRKVSTRGQISASGFVNHYEWGGLKADPAEWMRRYFDALVAIIVTQAVNAWLCRSPTRSLLQMHHGNALIAAGVALGIVLLALIAYTPPGQALFGTAPLPPRTWAFIVAFAPVLLLLEEARKRWVRHRLAAR